MKNTKKSFGEIWAELTTEQTEYLKGYIDRQRQDALKHYQAEQLRLHNVSNCYTEKDMDNAYDKGFNDGNQRDLTGSLIEVL